jgi:hypothetical protein
MTKSAATAILHRTGFGKPTDATLVRNRLAGRLKIATPKGVVPVKSEPQKTHLCYWG